jgi:hypothetical protein
VQFEALEHEAAQKLAEIDAIVCFFSQLFLALSLFFLVS